MPNQPKTKAHAIRVDDELWAAAEDEAKREGVTVSDIVRKALRQMLATVPLVLALAALLAWGGREVTFVGQPDPSQDPGIAMKGWVQASLDEQVAALGCDTKPRLSPRVAVRPAPVKGQHV